MDLCLDIVNGAASLHILDDIFAREGPACLVLTSDAVEVLLIRRYALVVLDEMLITSCVTRPNIQGDDLAREGRVEDR